MVAGDQRLVHTPFVPLGHWSPCAPLVWDQVKAPDIRFPSSHFRREHSRHEKAVFLPSGVAVTQSGQIIQCTTGSGQQPVLIFQQPQSQNTSQITSLSSGDQSLSRQSIINSQTMGSSTSIKPGCQQDGVYERLSGRRIRGRCS
ncbi:unnamed protein product [Schistosoma margrebowiei]|uniref:Uncharacterized protein n=1 Tax=Schistosoma margrebowiei TaxID=48269 RepID=A0A183NB11_9TREM|nr:unnamed protein product [Schistosoma margrebowiei]